MSLDSDYETAKAVALRVLHEALDSAASHPKEINPKGELQAILQDILPETPSYETEEKGQRDAENRFHSRVFWHGHATVPAMEPASGRRKWPGRRGRPGRQSMAPHYRVTFNGTGGYFVTLKPWTALWLV